MEQACASSPRYDAEGGKGSGLITDRVAGMAAEARQKATSVKAPTTWNLVLRSTDAGDVEVALSAPLGTRPRRFASRRAPAAEEDTVTGDVDWSISPLTCPSRVTRVGRRSRTLRILRPQAARK
jgi:hypothetical protein